MQPSTDMNSLAALHVFIGADTDLQGLFERAQARLPDDPGHDLAHALRVALWTVRIGGDDVEPRAAIAAALLHDIINVPKDDPRRANASALCAAEAQAILPEHGFNADTVTLISDAIRDHSFSRGATPESDLGRALQDADRLEALGAIGIMRTISTGTRMGGRYFDDADPWARHRSLNDIRFNVDHFFTKLLSLSATMRTEAGRAEAERRTRTLEAFLMALGEELGVPCPDFGADTAP